MMWKGLATLEQYAPYLLNRIMGRYNAGMRTELAALGLTTAKMRVLAILAAQPDLLIRDLGVYAVIEQSTLSRALDGLGADGLIVKRPDPVDSRSTRVALTVEGQQAFDRLWPHMEASTDRMFRDIDPAEREAFMATLRKMLRNVRTHDF